jgi:hypothetical protein
MGSMTMGVELVAGWGEAAGGRLWMRGLCWAEAGAWAD